MTDDRGRLARGASATAIAAAVLAYGLTDGSNEADGYAAPDYKPVNPPLVVAQARRRRWPIRTAGSRSRSST